MTLAGVLAHNIGISPPPLFKIGRLQLVDVSLSPFISSQIGCHAYFPSFKFIAHFLLSFAFASIYLNRSYKNVDNNHLNSYIVSKKVLAFVDSLLLKWLKSCFGLWNCHGSGLLYLKKYIQLFQGKILPLYINLTFKCVCFHFLNFFQKIWSKS